ncbi:MAG: beta-ribofuranosylaminobenzene 5'-phosphate synthase family protein [Chromatiales bacterium]
MPDPSATPLPEQALGAQHDGLTVTVTAPARLHLGFIDMSGDLGRRFGGLGLTLSGIQTRLSVTRSPGIHAKGPSSGRAEQCARMLLRTLGLKGGVSIAIEEAIPEHVGLGSGTQSALAICAAFVRLFDLDSDLCQLAKLTERGARSGIGLAAFESGGFLVDGGRGRATVVPPVLCQVAFPPPWRILLISDQARTGLNGSEEAAAFKQMPPMATQVSAHLCRVLLMQVLPALAEHDFDAFGAGITAIQEAVGDYFAPYQGGRYSSPRVGEVLRWLQDEGLRGVGQSSWGPTGFALVDSASRAHGLWQRATRQWGAPLSFSVCGGRNSGAEIGVRRKAA